MSEPESQSSDSPDAEARQWGMFAHLSALAGFIIPFGNIIGPLIIWQMKKEEIPFAGQQALEALNFHITVVIAFIISAMLTVILIGVLLMPIIGIAAFVLTIVAAIKANQGTSYEYPISWRVVK